jgi:hypothetical protein
MEFWAVIGLACLDQVFLRELEKNKANPERTVREYGFRLTRWELGELTRVLSLDSAFEQMGMICHMFWAEAFDPVDRAPCWWSAEKSADYDPTGAEPYVHPLRNGGPVPKPDDERIV